MVKLSQKRLNTLYEKNKNLYKVEIHDYSGNKKIELWKKNKRFGYYNFIDFIDSYDDENIKKAILEDIQKGDK